MKTAFRFAGVDWGTSRFRFWLLDADGQVLGERDSDEGLTSAQPDRFSAILESHLSAAGAPSDLPVVICGMAGSRQGWIEANYVDVPASPADIAAACVSVPNAARDIRIVPGLAQRGEAPDVIRGEETQLLGLLLGEPDLTGLVAMPGTHSKWVRLEGGKIAAFATSLTGELYALLRQHSILSHSLGQAREGTRADDPCFRAGVSLGLDDPGGLLNALFSLRAASLLEGLSPDDAAARLSGMLIGVEIAGAMKRFHAGGEELVLVASGWARDLYGAGLQVAGMHATSVDADQLCRTGLVSIARALWPDGHDNGDRP